MNDLWSSPRASANRALAAFRRAAQGLRSSLARTLVTAADLVEYGASGTRLVGGRIRGYEQNPKLDGSRWPGVAEEMLRTEPKLAMADQVMRHTGLTARWRFVAKNESPAARRNADFMNRNFGLGESAGAGRLVSPWEAQVDRMLPFARIGYRYLEVLYRVEDGLVWVSDFADCEPEAHERWVVDEGERLEAVTQRVWSGGGAGPIPAAKLVLLTLNLTGRNFEGRGWLRPAWPWYELKRHILDLLAVGSERWALATPVLEVDRALAQTLGYAPDAVTQMITEGQRAVAEYASGSSSYLVQTPAVRVGAFNAQGFNPDGLLKVATHCNQEMLAAGIANGMELGLGEVGSRSVGDLLQAQFNLFMVNQLDTIAGAVGGRPGPGRGAALRVLDWNFGAQRPEDYPALEHEGLEVDRITELLPPLPHRRAAGFATPTNEVERRIWRAVGLVLPAYAERSVEQRLETRNNEVAAPPKAIRNSGSPAAAE